MNRLTVKSKAKNGGYNLKLKSNIMCQDSKQESNLINVINTLGEYEATGLTPEQITELDKQYTELATKYAELKKENEWIYDRMPESTGECVQIRYNDATLGISGNVRASYDISWINDSINGFATRDGWVSKDKVRCWRTLSEPLPQPYEESDKQ